MAKIRNRDAVAANLQVWDAWSEHQARSAFYDLDGFANGQLHLRPYEIDEVGAVEGRRLLHLQCRFGTETLSWARLGADVTGVDFSSEAVKIARQLSMRTGLAGRFIESDVYDLTLPPGEFDITYTSRGVLCWLPDLRGWANVVSQSLKPGGVFYVTDIHPVARMFADEAGVDDLRFRYGYFNSGTPLVFQADPHESYATRSPSDVGSVAALSAFTWTHSLGDIVSSLADAGLKLEFLHEFPFCDWGLSFLVQEDAFCWRLAPGIKVDLPLSFSLRASKPR